MASLSLYFNKLSCQVAEALISPGILFVLFDLFFMEVDSMAFAFPSVLRLCDTVLNKVKSEGTQHLTGEEISYQECIYSYPCKEEYHSGK